MILGGHAIYEAFEEGIWRGVNIDKNLISCNSMDVRLDRYLKLALPGNKPTWLDVEAPYRLQQGDFMLATIKEQINCTAPLVLSTDLDSKERFFAPMFEGRSTLARMGLITHLSAGFGDYGFEGVFTLELYNVAPWPIELTEGMRIGQVSFHEVYDPITYKGAYQHPHPNKEPGEPKIGNW